MDRKVSEANQECLEFQVHQVFLVSPEIQASKVKRGPPLLDSQAHLGLLEWMARKECQETLRLVTRDLPEKGVFQEHRA